MKALNGSCTIQCPPYVNFIFAAFIHSKLNKEEERAMCYTYS